MTYDDYETPGAGAITDIKLPYGAYVKGHNWKIWSRMAGGGVILVVLMFLLGEPAGGFGVLLFTLAVALPLTVKTGLNAVPKWKEVGRPGGGLIGFGWRIQDPIGDVFLTTVWNSLRSVIKKRF